jgi:hypothetical protein
MTQVALDEHLRVATIERIARYTVGIGVEENTLVGTGTLIASGEDRFVLTAHHVIEDVPLGKINFWCRPPAPIIEKAAKDVTDAEVGFGRYTPGTAFPITTIIEDAAADIALLKIDPAFKLPGASEYYGLRNSDDFKNWPVDQLEGLSLFIFGFPIDNSRPLHTVGNRTFYFIGCASYHVFYSGDTNTRHWMRLSSKFSPAKDFLLDYSPPEGIKPHGFSGAGVWVITASKNQLVWGSDPALLGMVYKSFESLSLVAAVKLPKILELLSSS